MGKQTIVKLKITEQLKRIDKYMDNLSIEMIANAAIDLEYALQMDIGDVIKNIIQMMII